MLNSVVQPLMLHMAVLRDTSQPLVSKILLMLELLMGIILP